MISLSLHVVDGRFSLFDIYGILELSVITGENVFSAFFLKLFLAIRDLGKMSKHFFYLILSK